MKPLTARLSCCHTLPRPYQQCVATCHRLFGLLGSWVTDVPRKHCQMDAHMHDSFEDQTPISGRLMAGSHPWKIALQDRCDSPYGRSIPVTTAGHV